MKQTEGSNPAATSREPASARGRSRRRWRRAGLVLLVLVIALVGVRLALPSVVTRYVNRTLDRIELYSGEVEEVRLQLWRGAYSVRGARIDKTAGNVPVPLFECPRIDFTIRWRALLHGELVGRVLLVDPEVNFVDAPVEAMGQTGAEEPWLAVIRDLLPFRVDQAVVRNGSVHFRTYQGERPVDVYVSKIEATVDNLTNIRDELDPMPATVRLTGRAMDDARVEVNMMFDPLSYRPTFQLSARLLGLDVTELNDFARVYGNLDFEHGWFDLVMEAEAEYGRLQGYVKPLFRDLEVFSVATDVSPATLLKAFWEGLVGATTTVFENRQRKQFGTLIPFTADLSGATNADLPATVVNTLRNAFIRAYLPDLSRKDEYGGFLEFEPVGLVEEPSAAGSS